MHITGLKDLIQRAYKDKKFLTNGQILPNIDFSQPVLFEASCISNLGLVSIIRVVDDVIAECDRTFTRTHYLQLNENCAHQKEIFDLLQEHPLVAELTLVGLKPRISITGFTAFGKQPYWAPAHVEDVHRNGSVSHRKLQQEKHHFIRDVDLLPA